MADKRALVICIQTFLIQSVLSACIRTDIGCGCQYPAVASTGGSFVVTSSSPIAPTGVSVVSQNVYEGALMAGGDLPLLGSVGVEGEFATAGAGAVSYGCGDNTAAITVEEGPIITGIVAPASVSIFPGYAPYFGGYYGFGYGYPGMYGYGFLPGYGFC